MSVEKKQYPGYSSLTITDIVSETSPSQHFHKNYRKTKRGKMRIHLVSRIWLLVISLITLSGCAVLVAGGTGVIGTYAYVAGWMEGNYNVDLDRAYSATLTACRHLKLKIEKKTKNLSSGSITANDGNRTLWIKLKAQNSTATKISVRVGLIGNKPASQRVHAAIARALKG